MANVCVCMCVLSQEWTRSHGLHAVQTGGEAEPPADHGAGPPHLKSTYFQGSVHAPTRGGAPTSQSDV